MDAAKLITEQLIGECAVKVRARMVVMNRGLEHGMPCLLIGAKAFGDILLPSTLSGEYELWDADLFISPQMKYSDKDGHLKNLTLERALIMGLGNGGGDGFDRIWGNPYFERR